MDIFIYSSCTPKFYSLVTPNFLLININSLTGNMNLFILTNFFWERTSNFQSQHKVMERAWTNFICIIKQIVILLFASWPGRTIFRTIYITQLPLQQHTSSSSPDLPQLILPGSKTWPRSYKWYQACHAGLLWSTTGCGEQYVLSLLVVMSSSISLMNLGADDSSNLCKL